MKKIIFDDKIDFNFYIKKYREIENKRDLLDFINSIFIFFKNRIKKIIKEIEKEKNIEIKDINLWKMWLKIDGNSESEINFYNILKKYKNFFSEKEFIEFKEILSKLENQIITMESNIRIFELHNGNVDFWKKQNIILYEKFLEFKKILKLK